MRRRRSALVVAALLPLLILSGGGSGLELETSSSPRQDGEGPLQAVYEEAEAALEQLSQAITHTLFAWSALARGELLERLERAVQEWGDGGDYRVAAENVLLFTQWARARVLSALELAPKDEPEAVLELRRAQALLMAARGSREEVWRPQALDPAATRL